MKETTTAMTPTMPVARRKRISATWRTLSATSSRITSQSGSSRISPIFSSGSKGEYSACRMAGLSSPAAGCLPRRSPAASGTP